MKNVTNTEFWIQGRHRVKGLRRTKLPTFHDVGWSFPGDDVAAFSELKLPDATVRLLDKRVHLKALDEATRELNTLLNRSGRRKDK